MSVIRHTQHVHTHTQTNTLRWVPPGFSGMDVTMLSAASAAAKGEAGGVEPTPVPWRVGVLTAAVEVAAAGSACAVLELVAWGAEGEGEGRLAVCGTAPPPPSTPLPPPPPPPPLLCSRLLLAAVLLAEARKGSPPALSSREECFT